MARILDQLIYMTAACSPWFHGQNSRDSLNVAVAVPAVGTLVRFALLRSCLQ